jgi:hypothetical protein
MPSKALLANGDYQRVLHAKGVAASSGAAGKALDFFGAGHGNGVARMGGMGVVS